MNSASSSPVLREDSNIDSRGAGIVEHEGPRPFKTEDQGIDGLEKTIRSSMQSASLVFQQSQQQLGQSLPLNVSHLSEGQAYPRQSGAQSFRGPQEMINYSLQLGHSVLREVERNARAHEDTFPAAYAYEPRDPQQPSLLHSQPLPPPDYQQFWRAERGVSREPLMPDPHSLLGQLLEKRVSPAVWNRLRKQSNVVLGQIEVDQEVEEVEETSLRFKKIDDACDQLLKLNNELKEELEVLDASFSYFQEFG